MRVDEETRDDDIQEEEDNPRAHGHRKTAWDNVQEGWRIQCLCGWVTAADEKMAGAGKEFDDHLDKARDAAGK